MRIIGRDILDEFKQRHPPARKALDAWVALVAGNEFEQFPELKRFFHAADYVEPMTVFDVGGNKYRLIARVDYGLKTVVVKDVLTHADYNRDRWKR